MITGSNVSLGHRGKRKSLILKGVSFTIRKDRITTFIGHSGSGKTSLLNCVAGLYQHYDGSIRCLGQDLKDIATEERSSVVGFVLQQCHLFPHLTVLENCTYALVYGQGVSVQEAEQRTIDILSSLQMETYAQMFPAQLSGGQQQKIAIARALVLRPSVLLLDEPTSALDPESKRGLEIILRNLNRGGMTIALSSHDMVFIKNMADHVYFMADGSLIEEWDVGGQPLSSQKKIDQFLKQG